MKKYLIIIGVCWVSACSVQTDVEDVLDDYSSRIQRVTDTNLVKLDEYQPLFRTYPGRRERRYMLQDIRIGMLDFLDLYECGLQTLIAKRNNSLGKLMPMSQQLLYEHQLLVRIKYCEKKYLDSPQFDGVLEKLRSIKAVKLEDISKAYWNGTFGSREFEYIFSRGSIVLPMDENDFSNQNIIEAITWMIDLGDNLGSEQILVDEKRWEHHYFNLQLRQYHSELTHAMELLIYHLDAVSRLLNRWSQNRVVCHRGIADRKAKILQNLFYRHYIAKIQPYLTKTHRESKKWFELMGQLADKQARMMSGTFKSYYDKELSLTYPGSRWVVFNQSIENHTKEWQRLFSQCNMMPG